MNTIQQRIAAIFNEWARRYAQNPSEFGAILDADGKPVEDYGQQCSIYFEEIARDMDSKGLLPRPSHQSTSSNCELAEKMTDDRAHRIASIAAEEFVRCEGKSTDVHDQFAIPQCQADDHMRECIAHLCWRGEAMSYETDDGYIVVQLGDFTLVSVADA